ncbi:Lysozyme 1-like protein [Leptotrombidium deliense]|uniref:lysozyme n=1 Tax=Leptotrombidium deliense TaxID=299467 RepID=A0A443SQN0_9ACAR|nr:Lysozyme 1-like protein [Leptotrombidium deliense]
MFQIDKQYWTLAGRAGYRGAANDFERCVRDKNCAKHTVRAFMNKYSFDCNNDGLIDCFDFALIHRKGAKRCKESEIYTTDYWTRFETCYGFSR